MMSVATTSMVYADFSMRSFSYNSLHFSYKASTKSATKSDNTAAIAKYVSGSGDTMYFEMWASDGSSADAANYTVPHRVNGVSVKYYTARKGYYTLIPNTVYEKYGSDGYTKLVTYIFGTGTTTGEWSPTTK